MFRFLFLLCSFLVCLPNDLASLQSFPQNVATKRATSQIGSYTIIKFLGEGDQAKVYKAVDAKQKIVALKVFYTKSEFAKVHPERKRYLDRYFEADGTSKEANAEYRLGTRLKHPRIMKIFQKEEARTDTGEKVTFVVMEYIEGKNLDQVKDFSLSKKAAILLARELIGALQYSFSKGLIHDDLWSENLFVDSFGKLKMIDLGSFDELPSLHKGEKPKGTYRQYHIVMLHVLERLLELGRFTDTQREQCMAKIEKLAQKSENCPLAFETREKIAANLALLDALLAEFD